MNYTPEKTRAGLAILCAGLLLTACGGEPEQPKPSVAKLPAQTAAPPTQAPAVQLADPSATAPAAISQPGETSVSAPTDSAVTEPTMTQPPTLPPPPPPTGETLVGPPSNTPGGEPP
ncbi:MAG: hypothetical protein QF660_02575, partial [Anaerolineales bacterium]|nr:hypothetical protein [Anaerolineales bacterium]